MKAQPLKLENGKFCPCQVSEATHLKLLMPLDFDPLKIRVIPVQTKGRREGTPNWSWNGSIDKPTLRPSILTSFEYGMDYRKVVCHSWVTDGLVHFLDDSTHNLAGKTLPLIDIQEAV